MQLLLDAGGDPNAFILVDGGEREAPIPALYFAATGNNVPATRLLLERGANPNVVSYSSEKYATSPIRREVPRHRIASHGKSVDVARMLVNHGATVDLPRGDGRTAYVLAVRAGNQPVAD